VSEFPAQVDTSATCGALATARHSTLFTEMTSQIRQTPSSAALEVDASQLYVVAESMLYFPCTQWRLE
jgi:hypothetical protein